MNASADDDAIVEAFDRVCTQLGGFAERLNTEWIDGYLTALVAGPRTVMPSEWLPAVTGDAFERAFADPDDVGRAMEALLGRWNQIAADLNPEALDADPDALRLRPVLLQYEDEAPVDEGGEAERWTGMEWAGGFMQAAADHADDWSAPAQVGAEAAQQFEQCLDAIKALTLDDEGLARFVREAHGGKARARAELIHDACYAAQDLRLFWLDNAPRPSPLRVAPKPGRNDPCPCGSGLKFKKCCAAKQP